MYTVALLVLLGLVSATVTNVATDLVPAINKVPFIGESERLYALTAVLLVWLTDTSILGTFGMGNSAQWVDVVGSGLAVAGATALTEATVKYLEK